MPSDTEIVKSMELFSGLVPSEISKIVTLMTPVGVKEGETLTRAGETAHTFYVILSGNYMVSSEEGRAFTLHTPGDFLGWSVLNASGTYAGTSVALTDGEVLAMRSSDFTRLLQKDAVMGDKIMKTVSTRQSDLRYGFSFQSN